MSGAPIPDRVAHATALLDPDWLAADAALAPLLPLVASRHVAQDWHKAGTFRQHLHGIVRTLTLWHQPDPVRFLGLLHSVYGNSYVDLVKFDRHAERHLLQAAVGADTERLVYLFCTVPRTGFVQHLLTGPADDGSVELKVEGRVWRLVAEEVAAFIVVTLADMAEQWYAWQDEVFSRYPFHQDHDGAVLWSASLWPGPMRPTSRNLSVLSALVRALRHPALAERLPAPPIFGADGELRPQQEAAASALYTSVTHKDHPLADPDVAIALLEQAIALNPWVGEPHLLLAQLQLATRDWDAALASARAGLERLAAWGTAWDKRIAWEAWFAWGRILVQQAVARDWPDTLTRLNNVALAHLAAGASQAQVAVQPALS
jgi:hypothetical protein